MDEYSLLDNILPFRYGPFILLKILLGLIIPIPSPFIIPYIIPQAIKPENFKV